MATWEELLGPSTRTTATGGVRPTPAVIRRSDVMKPPPPVREPFSLGGAEPAGPGGFMGALAGLMESPVGKVIGKAGEVISLPGRAVTSAVQELKDALDGDPNTEASWGDLRNQMNDPTFGFGRIIGDLFPSDNGWGRFGNRALGFLGDVLLDPLTYVTFGGSKALSVASRAAGESLETGAKVSARRQIAKPVTGRSGREALAIRVLDATGDQELAKRAYRYGRSALSDQADDVFQRVGMDRAGIYFMGRRVGLTRVGEKLEGGLAGMRTWSGDHIFKRAADIFTPDDVADARKALARGTAPTERAEAYLRMIISDNLKRSAASQAARKADAGMRQIISDIGKTEFEAAAPNVHRILEGELPMVDELTGLAKTTDQKVAQRIADHLNALWKDVEAAAKAVDPNFEMFPVKNYFPHVMSDDAVRFVTRSNTKSATALREILFNPLDNAGAFRHRMTIDDEFFGFKLKDLDGPITVSKLNKIARDAGFKGDFFETNAATVLQKYVGNYAEQMGLIARKGYLVEKGVFKKLEDALKIDKDAIKQARAMLKEATDGRAKATGAAAAKAREALAAVNKNALTAIAVYDAKQFLDEALTEMLEYSGRLSSLYDEIPDAIRVLEDQYDSVIKQLESAREKLGKDTTTLQEMQTALAKVQADAERLTKIEEEIGVLGQFIQENLDKIMNGGKFAKDDTYGDLGRALRDAVKGGAGVVGTRDEAVVAASKTEWWGYANPAGDISVRQLQKMNAEQVSDIAKAALRGDASTTEMRQAILWVASANPALRAQQPELWSSLFGSDGIMSKAAKSDQYYKALHKTRDSGRKYARIATRRTNLIAGERVVASTIREYVAAQRLLQEFVGDEGSLGRALAEAGAIPNPMDKLEDLLSRPEFQDIAYYFDSLLGKTDEVATRVVSDGVRDLTLRADAIGTQLGQLSTDDIVRVLKGISGQLTDGKRIEFAVGYKTTGKFGEETARRTFTVDMSNLIDDVDWMVRYGTNDDIDDFIELVVKGSLKDSVTAPKAPGPRGAKFVRGAESGLEGGAARGGRARMRTQAENLERTAKEREEMARAALMGGDVETAGLQMAKSFADRLDAKAIRDTMTELLKRDAADNSIRGQLAKLEKEIATEFPEVPLSYFGTELSASWRTVNGKLVVGESKGRVGGTADVGRAIYEEAQHDLQESLTRMWFASDVYSRVEAATDVLATAGLVPGIDIVQEIYNKVAREFLEQVDGDVSRINDAVSGLSRIASDIRMGALDTPEKAYKAIQDLLDDPNVSSLVARRSGAADAPRILAKWNAMGGKTGQTQAFLELKAKDPTVAAEMRRQFREELRDWYQSMHPGARRDTNLGTIKDALDAAADAVPGVTRRVGGRRVKVEQYGPNASLEDMVSWLNNTVREIQSGSRRVRRSRNWLEKAADPFMDPFDPQPIGKSGWNMDLPSTLASILRMRAEQLGVISDDAARLSAKSAEARAAAEAAQAQFNELDMLAETLGVPSGQRPRMPLSQAQREGLTSDDLKQVRAVVRELFEAKNSPEYFAAVERQELNEVIRALAGIGTRGSDDVKIPLFRTHVTIAKQWFESGTPIFVKPNGSERWVPVTSASQIDRNLPAGSIAYKMDATATTGVSRVDPDELIESAQRNLANATRDIGNKAVVKKYFARLEQLNKRLDQGRVTPKSYERQANKLLDEVSEVTRSQGAVNVGDLQIVPDEMGMVRTEINRANSHLSRLKAQRDAITGSDALKPNEVAMRKAEVQAKIDKVESELNLLRSAQASKVGSFVSSDGVAIGFSPVEIESLFLTAGDRVGVQRLIDEDVPIATYLLELERDRTNGRIGAATRKMLRDMKMSEEARAVLERWLKSPSSVTGESNIGGLARVQADLEFLDTVVKPAWDREIARLTKHRDRINMLIKAQDPMVQNSALLKAHYVLQGIKKGDFTLEELQDGLKRVAKVDAPVERVRLAHLEEVWARSSDKKYLDKIESLEKTGQYASYRAVLRDVEKSRALAARMTEAADQLESRAARHFDMARQQEVAFFEVLGKLSSRLGDDVGYDTIARYQQLTTPVAGSRKKVYTPAEAIDVIRKEVKELVPVRSGPLAGTGTLVVGTSKTFGDELDRLADEAAYLLGEINAKGGFTAGAQVGFRKQMVASIAETADNLADQLDSSKKAWAKERKPVISAAKSEAKKASTKLQRAGKSYVKAITKFDESKLFAMSGTEYAETVIPVLEGNKERLVKFLEDMATFAGRKEDDLTLVQDVMAWLDEADGLLDDLAKISDPEQIEILTRLKVDLANMESEIIGSANSSYLAAIQRGLDDGTLGQEIVKKTSRGFNSLKPYGLPSYQAEEWLSEMFVNMSRLQTPEFARSLSKFLGRYTGFFKAYAVSTPGFVVRNAMSNTFMMVAAGADVRNLGEGLGLYRAWLAAVKTGDEAAWLAKQNPRVADAIAAMDASGYGRATEALRAFNPKRKWLVDNAYVRKFRSANEWFEGSARFMLAYDTVMKGGDFNMATARVKRYLFDYSTSTPADDVMRTIIPFWFWMSRNLPMQIVNQYENPRAYLLYQKAMRAIQAEEDEDDIVPLWLRQAGGVKVADGLYMNPDLGFNRIQEELEMLADPMRLMSRVNPGLRVPLEAVFANRKLYRDIPFSERAQPTPGGPLSPAVQALAMLMGQSKEMPDGSRGTTDRFNYALSNLVPPIAQISRLAPADDYQKERVRSNWASYFGIPLREVTPGMIQAELRRRSKEGM